jgi:VanZ family protein
LKFMYFLLRTDRKMSANWLATAPGFSVKPGSSLPWQPVMMLFRGKYLPLIRRAGFWLLWPAIAVVAWGELTPNPPALAQDIWDKAEHFTAYFGLALLATLAWGLRRSLVFVYLGVVALGGALEILQALTGRDASWLDETANALGALAGLAVAAVYLAMPRRLVDDARRS